MKKIFHKKNLISSTILSLIFLSCTEDFTITQPDLLYTIPVEECEQLEDYVVIDEGCYYEPDLAFLEKLIENNSTLTDPLGLGDQLWVLGRLFSFSWSYGLLYMSIPPEIGNLTNLTYLKLAGNKLTGEIPMEIGNLTNLTYLELGDNELTGEIPMEIGNLTNLIYLYLSYNELTGEIPVEIGNLTNLIYLDLRNNGLTGEIPVEIGKLTNLTILYLKSNALMGQIPESFCNINLSAYDFSDNNLCPPWPSCLTEDDVGIQDCDE